MFRHHYMSPRRSRLLHSVHFKLAFRRLYQSTTAHPVPSLIRSLLLRHPNLLIADTRQGILLCSRLLRLLKSSPLRLHLLEVRYSIRPLRIKIAKKLHRGEALCSILHLQKGQFLEVAPFSSRLPHLRVMRGRVEARFSDRLLLPIVKTPQYVD